MTHNLLRAVILFFLSNVICYVGFSKSAKKNVKSGSPVVSIGKIDGESTGNMTILTVRLSSRPDFSTPVLSSHGTFLQMKLPDTVVTEPGVFYDIKSPWLKKVVAYQAGERDAIVRIFTSSDPELILKAADTDLLDRRLVVSVNHKGLTDVTRKNAGKSDQEQLQDENKLLSESPAVHPLADAGEPAFSSASGFDEILIRMAWFSAGMFLLILFALSLRRIIRNRRILAAGPAGSVPMKTLNDLVLAPRQKLSLVQVGGEKLLLSVSPDGISLISHLEDVRRKQPLPLPQKAVQERIQPSGKLNRLLRNQKMKSREGTHVLNQPGRQPAEGAGKQAKTARATIVKKNKKSSHKSVNFAVDDDGIHEHARKEKESPESSTERAIDDVTQLIREKLKSLPKI